MKDRRFIILIGAFLLLSACGSPQAAQTSQAAVAEKAEERAIETANAFGSALPVMGEPEESEEAEGSADEGQRELDVRRYNDEFYIYGLKIGDGLDRAIMRLGEPDEYVAANPDYDTTASAVWHLAEDRLDLEIYYDEGVIDSFYMGELTPEEEQRIRSGLGEPFSAGKGLWEYENAEHYLKIEAFSGETDYRRLYAMRRADENRMVEETNEPASEAPSLHLDLNEFRDRLTTYYRQYYDALLAESSYAEVEGMPEILVVENGYFYGTLPGNETLVGSVDNDAQVRWAAIRSEIRPAGGELDTEMIASQALSHTALLQAFVSSVGDAEAASEIFDSLFDQQYEQLVEQPVYDAGERTYLTPKSEGYHVFAVMSSEDASENLNLDILLRD